MRLLKDSNIDTDGIALKNRAASFPDDFREWIDEAGLARMTLVAVEKAVDETRDFPDRFHGFQAKSILAALCYCYSAGIYDSHEIQLQIRSNQSVAYLASQWRPTGHDLRLFRREFREVLESALSWLTLINLLWKETRSGTSRLISQDHFFNQLDLDGVMDWNPFQTLKEDSYQRVQEAVAEDTMTMDE